MADAPARCCGEVNGRVSSGDYVRYLFAMSEPPALHPLRDLFDVAVRGRAVRLTCSRCGHGTVVSSHALWWLFHKKGWVDTLREVRRRCLCIMCLHRRGVKVRDPELDLVDEAPTDTSLPMPSELDWKREVRRRR
jgi:ribosomal protein S27AE